MKPLLQRIFVKSTKFKLLQMNARHCFVSAGGDSEPNHDINYVNDFKKGLREANIAFKEGYTCLHMECKLCKQTSSMFQGYLNKKTGMLTSGLKLQWNSD